MMWHERSEEQRRRDIEAGDKMRANTELSVGFLKNVVRPLLAGSGREVGLVGKSSLSLGGELLVEEDGITYKISVSVNRD